MNRWLSLVNQMLIEIIGQNDKNKRRIFSSVRFVAKTLV